MIAETLAGIALVKSAVDGIKGAINTARRSRIRSYVKRVEVAITEGRKDDAMEALKQAQPEIMRGVTRGVLHKNTASRKVSRLNTRIKAMSA